MILWFNNLHDGKFLKTIIPLEQETALTVSVPDVFHFRRWAYSTPEAKVRHEITPHKAEPGGVRQLRALTDREVDMSGQQRLTTQWCGNRSTCDCLLYTARRLIYLFVYRSTYKSTRLYNPENQHRQHKNYQTTFQDFLAVSMKMTGFWDIERCSLAEADSSFIVLIMEAVHTSETSMTYETKYFRTLSSSRRFPVFLFVPLYYRFLSTRARKQSVTEKTEKK